MRRFNMILGLCLCVFSLVRVRGQIAYPAPAYNPYNAAPAAYAAPTYTSYPRPSYAAPAPVPYPMRAAYGSALNQTLTNELIVAFIRFVAENEARNIQLQSQQIAQALSA